MPRLRRSQARAAFWFGIWLVFTPPATAQQPSFNCAKATTPVEGAICASPTLSALDRKLAKAFGDRRKTLSRSGRDQLLSDQRNWLRQRDRCGADANCLASSMTSRISVLEKTDANPPARAAAYFGRWQPYGREATFFSAMTLTPDRLSYDDGLIYGLRQVRPGSNVFRIRSLQGEGPEGRGGATHKAFVVHEGLLQIHTYVSDIDPADPPALTATATGPEQKGRFSVGFYSR